MVFYTHYRCGGRWWRVRKTLNTLCGAHYQVQMGCGDGSWQRAEYSDNIQYAIELYCNTFENGTPLSEGFDLVSV